jgi:putative transposase
MADGGMGSLAVDIREIAQAMGRHKTAAERRATREGWPFQERTTRGGRQRIYPLASLPPDVQAAVLLARRQPSPEQPAAPVAPAWNDDRRRAVWARYDRAPDVHKETARRRLAALQAVNALVSRGHGLVSARATVAAQLRRDGLRGGSPATLARWAAEIEGVPADCRVQILLPSYTGRTAAAEIPPEAWDQFRADYLRAEAPSATACYERVQRAAAARGWDLPCMRTFVRRLEQTIPLQVRVLAREGAEALDRLYPAQQRDHGVFAALEAVNADGHRFDVFCKWPDGTVARPIMVAWQCIGTGKMLARRVGQTENSDLVRLSFADMASRYGLPQHAWLDNGRGFANKYLTGGTPTRYRFRVREDDPVGVLTALVGQIHWATPYHGQAKPIERAFRDLAEYVSKNPALAGAYTGNRPDAKPENYGSRAVPIEHFMQVLDAEIAAHNARAGRKGGVCRGRSFDQVFAESYRETMVRKATAEQLRSLLLCSEKVTASRRDGSVTLPGLGNRYWIEALARHMGQPVLVRFDPDNLHDQVAVYTLAGEFIADAPCVHAVGFADTAAGREHARAKKQWRRAAREQLDAERRMTAAQVAAQVPAPPPEDLPSATVVQGAFGRGEALRPAKPAPSAEPARRTGTDDTPHEAALGDLLLRMQRQQLRDRGWEPPTDD